MKLKSGVSYEYLEHERIIKFDLKTLQRNKKIFSRNIPIILGLNQYNSIGYGLLNVFGAIEKEPIDPFYTIRGALIEYLAFSKATEIYEAKGIKLPVFKVYDDQTVFDVFNDPNNKTHAFFGGKPDFIMKKPYVVVHEVKSKDIDKLDSYKEDPCETMQLETYCYLLDTEYGVMMYGFPKKRVVDALHKWLDDNKNDPSKFIPRDFAIKNEILKEEVVWKFIPKKFNKEETYKKLIDVYKTVNEFGKTGIIHEKDFFNNELVVFDNWRPF
jgi:hypothetical protein